MPSFHLHQEAQAASYGHNAAILLGCLRPERRVECLREGLKKSKLLNFHIYNLHFSDLLKKLKKKHFLHT